MAPLNLVPTFSITSPTDENSMPTALKESVNASKLNELMSNLDARLAGGLHGEYFEKGSRLDDKHRHGQLETVFALRKEMADIKAQLDKQEQQAAEAEQTKVSGKGGAPAASKNMIAAIKNIVAHELSEKLRDLSVRNERLEANMKKAEERIDSLANENKTMERKLKKAEERNHHLNEKLSGSHTHVVEQRVKKLEAENMKLQSKLAGVEHSLHTTEERVQRLENGGGNASAVGRVRAKVSELEMNSELYNARLHRLEEWRDREEEY